MAVARVTESTASSSVSFDDAITKGIQRANESPHNIRGAWVQEQKVTCDEAGNIQEYRVNMKVTFVLD